MTYSNILLKAGFRNFMIRSNLSGVDGFILPDLAIEESCYYIEQATRLGLATVFLASPNTPENRLKAIVNKCSGFVYIVSVYGITGVRRSFESYTVDAIKNIKHVAGSKIPVAVGFGISNASHIRFMVDAGADAVIIGSAIVEKIKSNPNKEKMLLELRSYIVSLKNACK
jgi:tryptophan synthase alpha chain